MSSGEKFTRYNFKNKTLEYYIVNLTENKLIKN